ncbi:tetratricopeptide repeat protein [uncultured Pontibacter sp.]|uniref:tetratricopeptide repeat protein n=1 Tax=uncultured Pontibacter sp. TaxID=453356 RepID=UPI00262A7247|nr:tetratricopeptide repeat protein [uncultured Pontibacter sp.]
MSQSGDKDQYAEEIKKAWQLFENQKLEDAERICIRLKQDFPEKLGYNYLLGCIFFNRNDYSSSKKELQLALLKDTDKKSGGWINYLLGKIHNDYFFDGENEFYDKELAIRKYEAALKYKDFPEGVISELHTLYKNDYKKISLYKSALITFPKNPEYYITLSDIYKRKHKYAEQFCTLSEAVNQDLSSSTVMYELGKYYAGQKDYSQALEYFSKSMVLCDNQDSHFAINIAIANTYYQQSLHEKAEEYYKLAFIAKSESSDCWFGFFGLLSTFNIAKSFDKIEYLIKSLNLTSEVFPFNDWLGDEPIYLDPHSPRVPEIIFPYKEIVKILNQVEKKNHEEELVGRINLIKCLLHKLDQAAPERFVTLRKAISSLDAWQYDFLIQELVYSYSDYFSDSFEKNASVSSLLSHLSLDLEQHYSFKNLFCDYLSDILDELHSRKYYKEIAKLYGQFSSKQLEEINSWFEFAYAFNEIGKTEKAKNIYNKYIEINGEHSSVLNNLANIYKVEDKIDKAIELYNKALQLDEKNELAQKNLSLALERKKIIDRAKSERLAIEKTFSNSINSLKEENFFSIETLHTFLLNIKKEEDFDNWRVPIQDEMFPVLMKTTRTKANSLRSNWLAKNYLIDTTEFDEYNIPYYLVNPLLENKIEELRSIVSESSMPLCWTNGLENLSIQKLDEIEYFRLSKKISKIGKKYKTLITRDFDELVFNHLIGNIKSTVVLSGSFVELILTYFCEKKKLKRITYSKPSGGSVSKNLYDCVLSDLIIFIEQNNLLGTEFFHLTNLSRVYRNYVHPGLELKNSLDKTKSDICFISSIHIMKKVLLNEK